MPECYFAVGTTLATLQNIETIVTEPPNVQPDRLIALTGGVRVRTLDKLAHHVGDINSGLAWWFLSQADLDNLHNTLFGNYPVFSSSVIRYVSVLDESGRYSPFLCVIEKPRIGRDYRLIDTGSGYENYVLPLYDLDLQYVSKNEIATLTASERLVLANTAVAGYTLTLPLANAVNANTVVSIVKTATVNTLSVARQGSDTLNGGTAVITLTAVNSRYDLVSDGASAWVTI